MQGWVIMHGNRISNAVAISQYNWHYNQKIGIYYEPNETFLTEDSTDYLVAVWRIKRKS